MIKQKILLAWKEFRGYFLMNFNDTAAKLGIEANTCPQLAHNDTTSSTQSLSPNIAKRLAPPPRAACSIIVLMVVKVMVVVMVVVRWWWSGGGCGECGGYV